MNVLGVCKYQHLQSGKCNVSLFGECNVYIFSVDFGCFSTGYRHCEGLWEREEQVIFTLFFYAPLFLNFVLFPQKESYFADLCSKTCIFRKFVVPLRRKTQNKHNYDTNTTDI